jgi:uncharacterized UBP type Zn finger protein
MKGDSAQFLSLWLYAMGIAADIFPNDAPGVELDEGKKLLSSLVNSLRIELVEDKTCLTCGHQTRNFSAMLELILALPAMEEHGKTLVSLLADYFSDFDISINCDKELTHQSATQSPSVGTLPRYLLLQLGRLDEDGDKIP